MISTQKGNFEVNFLQNKRNSLMSCDHSEIAFNLDT